MNVLQLYVGVPQRIHAVEVVASLAASRHRVAALLAIARPSLDVQNLRYKRNTPPMNARSIQLQPDPHLAQVMEVAEVEDMKRHAVVTSVAEEDRLQRKARAIVGFFLKFGLELR